jgi:hypothetical protein
MVGPLLDMYYQKATVAKYIVESEEAIFSKGLKSLFS